MSVICILLIYSNVICFVLHCHDVACDCVIQDLYLALQKFKFKTEHIEEAMKSSVLYGGDLHSALDWLCLNLKDGTYTLIFKLSVFFYPLIAVNFFTDPLTDSFYSSFLSFPPPPLLQRSCQQVSVRGCRKRTMRPSQSSSLHPKHPNLSLPKSRRKSLQRWGKYSLDPPFPIVLLRVCGAIVTFTVWQHKILGNIFYTF